MYQERYKNQLYQNAYENAYDCHYYGMDRKSWSSCGVRTKAKRDEIWKLAFYDCAEGGWEHGYMKNDKYHFFKELGGDAEKHYKLDCDRGPVFKTLREASKAASEILRKTGHVLQVIETGLPITHVYNA